MSSKTSQGPAKVARRGLSRAEKIAAIVIILIVIWGIYSYVTPSTPPATSTTTGPQTTSASNLAPDFTLSVVGPNGLTGEKVSLSSFRGKVVVLELMEPWCEFCQAMAPTMEKLYDQYAGQNVVFLAVSGPFRGATSDTTAKFIRDYNSRMIYVFDSTGTVFNTYHVNSTPTYFIIGKDGSIAAGPLSGVQSFDMLAGLIARANS